MKIGNKKVLVSPNGEADTLVSVLTTKKINGVDYSLVSGKQGDILIESNRLDDPPPLSVGSVVKTRVNMSSPQRGKYAVTRKVEIMTPPLIAGDTTLYGVITSENEQKIISEASIIH